MRFGAGEELLLDDGLLGPVERLPSLAKSRADERPEEGGLLSGRRIGATSQLTGFLEDVGIADGLSHRLFYLLVLLFTARPVFWLII